MTDREACVAFNLTDNIGSVGVTVLAKKHGSVAAAWEAYPNQVARDGGEVDWAREFALADRYGAKVVTFVDADYPAQLKAAPGCPLVLYVMGSVEVLSRPSVAIVGTRRATPYGLEQAYVFGSDLAADGWVVVSGLALGIDGEAHRGALAAGGRTVGVLGSALDRFYPEGNREVARQMVKRGGAVVSEFPFGRPPDQQTFPIRNHVVAGLVRGVVAVESPLRSGTLITTSIAADLGRTIMAVPSRVDSRSSAGCLQLIREGAVLVRHAGDVNDALSELIPVRRIEPTATATAAARSAETAAEEPSEQPQSAHRNVKPVPAARPADTPPPYTVEEALIVKALDSTGVHLDELVRRTALPAAKVSSLCMTLRIKGRVRFLPGNRVALPPVR